MVFAEQVVVYRYENVKMYAQKAYYLHWKALIMSDNVL